MSKMTSNGRLLPVLVSLQLFVRQRIALRKPRRLHLHLKFCPLPPILLAGRDCEHRPPAFAG